MSATTSQRSALLAKFREHVTRARYGPGEVHCVALDFTISDKTMRMNVWLLLAPHE